ncbi:hypothetical protein [Chitinophaga rhizophila]|uniref:Peptidase S74 domain-containing protein n=1 Tax=Chitinophaga rhizophila TaxID=2866212 RepID=A0ABS7GHV2_9BACT|nr:hypothetical protein [Chitinophaga rhizophila]MBW8687267.1 hypothetical protein [Chitinophaga rhizophila]
MKTRVMLTALTLSAGLSYGQNTFPASGNVGINTSTPTFNLDVNGTFNANYISVGKSLRFIPGYTTIERGGYNTTLPGYRTGRKLHIDEQFETGTNNITVYNNSANGAVTHSRITQANLPNGSGYCIEVSHTGAASPGLGGFQQPIAFASNKTFVQVFRAKLPIGYSFQHGSNSVGTGGNRVWLTNNEGTGRWEDYAVEIACGSSGTFSNGGYIYVSGTAATAENPLIWQLATCSSYDMSDYSEATILNQQAADQPGNLRITGNGFLGGNVGIGTSDTKGYKLAVNGDAVFTKAVVKLFGNWPDYVFGSDYQLPSLAELQAYIQKERHLPHIPAASEVAASGINLGETQKALVKTLEEQALYILQLNAEIEVLKKAVAELKAARP